MNHNDRSAHGWECSECGRKGFYHRTWCPTCGATNLQIYSIGTGRLLVQTTVTVTPPDIPAPNVLGIAEFEESISVIARLDPGDPPVVGDQVTLKTNRPLRGDEHSLVLTKVDH